MQTIRINYDKLREALDPATRDRAIKLISDAETSLGGKAAAGLLKTLVNAKVMRDVIEVVRGGSQAKARGTVIQAGYQSGGVTKVAKALADLGDDTLAATLSLADGPTENNPTGISYQTNLFEEPVSDDFSIRVVLERRKHTEGPNKGEWRNEKTAFTMEQEQ